MKYKAIIFDLDDTLLESRLVVWEHHKHVAKKFYNIDLTDEEIRKHWGKPLTQLIGHLYKNSDTVENMHNAVKSVREDFRKKIYPDAVDVIKKILEEGALVGVLSASNIDHIKEDLIRFNVPIDLFISIQGEEHTTAHKPDPNVFAPMLEKLSTKGIKKEEVLYVGDSLDDFRAASGAGVNFIGVTTGLFSKEDFEKEGAKILIPGIKELLDFI
jgi:HAD superfamily hydrolase (TIGR01662 family)